MSRELGGADGGSRRWCQLSDLERFSVATIQEFLPANRLFNDSFWLAGWSAGEGQVSVAGRVRTVLCGADDNRAVHRALGVVQPGEFLVIQSPTARAALWGDILTEVAVRRGVKGVVVDGAVRDSSRLSGYGVPIWYRVRCAATAAKSDEGFIDVPLAIAGVLLKPGYVVVGDHDGLVGFEPDLVHAVVRQSGEHDKVEGKVRAHLLEGGSYEDFLGREPTTTE